MPLYQYAQNATNSDSNNSVVRVYYNDSVIAMERWYDGHKKIDSIKTYYKSGELNEHFNYTKGSFDGLSYKFKKSGEKLTTWQFKKGKLIERTDHILDFNKKDEEKIKKFHAELKEINQSLKENPKSFKSHFIRANLRHKLGNYTLALKDFKNIERYLLKVPADKKPPIKMLSSIYDIIGTIYSSYEMENQAIHYRYKAVKTSPDDMRVAYNLGAYFYTVKSYRLAFTYLNKALEKWPKHSFSHRVLGALYTDFEEYDKAMKHINMAFPNEKNLIRLGDGNLERDIRTIRGYLYHKLGDSEKGIADLDEALILNENNSFALRNLGVIYHDLGDHDKACELLQKAKKLGYEKTHDRFDLDEYLEFSCHNKTPEKPGIKLSQLPFVHPNPAKEMVTIENFNYENFGYHIFNFESKLIQEGVADSKSINVSSFPTGLYILKIEVQGVTHSFKVVKE